LAIGFLAVVTLLSFGADCFGRYDAAAQFRDHPDEAPTRTFLLGTDELGRDRFSRLLHGSRLSLICAPGAALIATAISAAIGIAGGYYGGWVDEVATAVTDLFLSLPWLFALLTLRALLPLNVSKWVSIGAVFLLLAAVGWAAGARVIRAAVAGMGHSGPLLHARAYGCGGWRLFCFHLLPNLRPVLAAQFWLMVPVCLLTEANLGILGLGINEPTPSWGNILAELQNYQRIPETPWILIPGILLIMVVGSLHLVVSGSNTWE